MEHNEAIPYYRELVVFLAAAGIIVPVFHRLRISPVLGFLVAGIVIGPFGLALFANDLPVLRYLTIGEIGGVRLIAEFGIMFLLFTIGLDLSLRRLWQLRRLVFGLGVGQMLLTAAAIAGIALLLGTSTSTAIVLGSSLALSSTAIVMQLLVESRRTAAPIGRASFAILLLQDLAVVPVLLLLGFLAAAKAGATAEAAILPQLIRTLLGAVLAIGGIVLFGRYLITPLYRMVGGARSPGLFMALTLLMVIAMAAVTGAVGLSMALGAFLAGLLLAESEFRHAVEVSIEPFKALLLGLFFLSVGMGIDLRMTFANAVWVILAVVGLFVVKGSVIGLLALLFRQGRAVAVEMALLLGQGGEFVFVVVALAERLGLLPQPMAQFILLVVSLSMLLTPFTAQLGRHLAQRLRHNAAMRDHGPGHNKDEAAEGHVVICGYGRVGRNVSRMLDSEKIPWVALDNDAENVARHRQAGAPVHFGDASRDELLHLVGTDRAMALVVTLDDPVAASHLVAAARQAWPKLPIHVRARDIYHADDLYRAGASHVVAEAAETALQLGALALESTGLPDDAVHQRVERMRSWAMERIDAELKRR